MRWRQWLARRVALAMGESAVDAAQQPIDPLLMDDVWIHYKFVFDVGRTIDLTDAAARLLDTDLGVVAVTQHHTWDAKRLATIKDYKAQFELLQEAGRHAEGGIMGFGRYMMAHPQLVRALWKGRRPRTRTAEPREDDRPDLSFGKIEDLIAEQSKLQALFRYIDADIFNPDFIQQDPWLRAELQPLFARDSRGDYGIDVGLVLHRSGTAIVTFYVAHDGPASCSDLASLSLASLPRFQETELAAWIAEAAAAERGWEVVPPSSRQFSSGINWDRWVHEEPAALSDIFSLYQGAMLACLAAKRPKRPRQGEAQAFSSQWSCYPVVSVRRPSPRAFDFSDASAQEQLGYLVARGGPSGGRFRPEHLRAQASNDLSITPGERCWVNGALALLLVSAAERAEMASRYNGDSNIPGQDWVAKEQLLAAPIDFLLIQYHTAHALVAQINASPLSARSLHRIKARVLAAKADLESPSRFTYASLREIEGAFHRDRQTAKSWQLVDDSLRLVEGVLDAEDRAAAARRSLSLELVLGVIAIVLGVPAAHRMVEITGRVESQPDSAYAGFGKLVNLLSATAANHPGPAVVLLVTLLVALILAAIFIGWAKRTDRAPLMSRARGAPPRTEPYQYFPGLSVTYLRAQDDEVPGGER